MGLSVDVEQCRRVGVVAERLRADRDYFLPPPPAGIDREQEALFWFIVTGICQQTRALRGVIDGRTLRGSDYLVAAMRRHLARNPKKWRPQALASWGADDLRAAVSDTGDPKRSTLDRVDERLRLLRAMARFLLDLYGGSVLSLFEASTKRAAGAGGLLERLAGCEAYSDPVEKKSHLLIMYLNELGIWPVADPENLEIAVDYHVMRVALRTGMIKVEDDALRRKLAEHAPVDEATDARVRQAAREACKTTLRSTPSLTPFRLDNFLWMIGRNCCFYEHQPVCTRPGHCWKIETCSLRESFRHECGATCPLAPACRAAVDPERRALRETNFVSHYY